MNKERNINQEVLKPIVKKILNIKQTEDININSWEIKKFKVGTVGEVYIVEGDCICSVNDAEKKVNWDVVLKIQKKWDRIGDPESWKREFLMYHNNVFKQLPNNFNVPNCYEMKIENNEVWLWLENIKGITNKDISIEDYEMIAKNIGEYQGILNRDKDTMRYPWMSSRYWYAITLVNWCTDGILWLDDELNNEDKRKLDLRTIESLYSIWNNRDELLDIMNNLPKTLCHRDFHPANIFITKKSEKVSNITLIDWDCVGIGVLGEDIADLLGETLTYFDYDIEKASDLMDIIFSNYMAGLREVNCNVEEDVVRLGYTMCFVMHWGFRVYFQLKCAKEAKIKERYIRILNFVSQKTKSLNELVEKFNAQVHKNRKIEGKQHV